MQRKNEFSILIKLISFCIQKKDIGKNFVENSYLPL